jgi:hypothetical protein
MFNSQRALAPVDKNLQVKEIGHCKLIFDNNSPQSIYYNRVKGFGINDVDKLDQILNFYYEKGIVPCFDMTPNNINEKVAMALASKGFINFEQLAFLQLANDVDINLKQNIKIVKVNEENAEEFVNIVVSTSKITNIDKEVIQRKKHYFCNQNFHNYIAYIGDKVAAIGSLFIRGDEGYIANDYTFEEFRGQGCQTALLLHRIKEAKEKRLINIYTDVEFGSISHNNMEKLGFKTVFINSFWTK